MTRRFAIGLAQLPLMAVMGVAEFFWHRYRDSPNGRLDHMTALLAIVTAIGAGLLGWTPFARSIVRRWLAAFLLALLVAAAGLGAYALYRRDDVDPSHVLVLVGVWGFIFGVLALVDYLTERSHKRR